jgi:flagellar protein FliO/FliZ
MRQLARFASLLAMVGATAALPCAAAETASTPPQTPAATSTAADAPASAAAAPAPAAAPAFDNGARPPLPAPIVSPPANVPAPTASFMQTMLGLVAVLALLLGLAWLLKRFGPRQPAGNAQVKLVGALSLGGRERILVVEVGEQWIVVGAAPGQVNALATMPRQEIEGGAESSPASASFAQWLQQTIDKRNKQ